MVQGREFAFVSLLWRAAVEQIYREDGGGGCGFVIGDGRRLVNDALFVYGVNLA